VRASNRTSGPRPPKRAGTIHSDFERGFVSGRSDPLCHLSTYRHEVAAKAAGEVPPSKAATIWYTDGDVMHFRFNV
jgi:ribosome-binding ATPase YchF (GTP1/OBG family)